MSKAARWRGGRRKKVAADRISKHIERLMLDLGVDVRQLKPVGKRYVPAELATQVMDAYYEHCRAYQTDSREVIPELSTTDDVVSAALANLEVH